MRPWIDMATVTGLAACAAAGAWWLSRRRGNWWLIGYGLGLLLFCAVGAVQWHYMLTFVRPFSWVAAGRREFAVTALAVTILFCTLIPRVRQRHVRWLVGVLVVLAVYAFGVHPFIGPALVRHRLERMVTAYEPSGVCIQTTSFTCGPAAAVTALKQLGLDAEEGDLAMLSYSTPGWGTPPDMLCAALNKRYRKEGLHCEFRRIRTTDDLAEAGITIAVVKYKPLVDHYLAVLDVSEDEVVVGDPNRGLRAYFRGDFDDRWKGCGIVMRRDGMPPWGLGLAVRPRSAAEEFGWD
jgi:predicted double-glycine peptidase